MRHDAERRDVVRERLYAFFITDDAARWKAYLVTAVVAVLTGVAVRAFGASDRLSGIVVVVTTLLIVTLLTAKYVLKNEK